MSTSKLSSDAQTVLDDFKEALGNLLDNEDAMADSTIRIFRLDLKHLAHALNLSEKLAPKSLRTNGETPGQQAGRLAREKAASTEDQRRNAIQRSN